jgi:site-specific recombinase XerD
MFSQLFSCPRAVEQYEAAPLLEARVRHLTFCAAQGATLPTLKRIAFYQRALCQVLNVERQGTFTFGEIRAAADRWVSRRPRHHAHRNGKASKAAFMTTANAWLRFLGRIEPRQTCSCPCPELVQAFSDDMRCERGLSPLTIYTRSRRVEEFLARYCVDAGALRHMRVVDIDRAIAEKGTHDGCTRASLRTYAYVLRSFFRFAETRGWCPPGIAAGIVPPRVYTDERLPAAPSWEDVQRLCAGTDGHSRAQIRDRALLLLFAVYGLRVGEVRRLRLEDLDWERETIRIRRTKQQRGIHAYPLVRPVGDAISRYLVTARPRADAREVFLSLKAPIRSLGNSAFWQIVNRRLRSLGLTLAHQGRHALRHACATRLLARGLSMKEIGDHLGHRNPAATSVYAKVNLAALRQVADFSLEALV